MLFLDVFGNGSEEDMGETERESMETGRMRGAVDIILLGGIASILPQHRLDQAGRQALCLSLLYMLVGTGERKKRR